MDRLDLSGLPYEYGEPPEPGEGERRRDRITLQMGQTTLRPTARASSWEPLAFWFRSALRRCASIFCFPRVILSNRPLRRPEFGSGRVWILLRVPSTGCPGRTSRSVAVPLVAGTGSGRGPIWPTV
jgi:hypothetical protein